MKKHVTVVQYNKLNLAIGSMWPNLKKRIYKNPNQLVSVPLTDTQRFMENTKTKQENRTIAYHMCLQEAGHFIKGMVACQPAPEDQLQVWPAKPDC